MSATSSTSSTPAALKVSGAVGASSAESAVASPAGSSAVRLAVSLASPPRSILVITGTARAMTATMAATATTGRQFDPANEGRLQRRRSRATPMSLTTEVVSDAARAAAISRSRSVSASGVTGVATASRTAASILSRFMAAASASTAARSAGVTSPSR